MTLDASAATATDVRARVVAMHARIQNLAGVHLPLELWDGTRLGPEDPTFVVRLRDGSSLRALLWPPSDLTAGEAYVHDAVDISGDMVSALAVGERLARAMPRDLRSRLQLAADLLRLPKPPPRPTARRARLHGRVHSVERDRAAIEFHYDLAQVFYETFLDRRLVYSCAYFAPDDDSLDRAQLRKLDLVCRKLRLQPDQRLLDIGCGWGSLLRHAAQEYGVTGVGVTLSRTQAEAGRQMLDEAGLSDRVEIRLQDYRQVAEQFDAVASIGMVEHVGPANLERFMRGTRRLLPPGGPFLCHGIVTSDPKQAPKGNQKTFVSQYVFPDGGLSPAWRMVQAMETGGFEVVDVEQLRPHYARTLRHWVRNLEANHERAVAAASETDYRIWRTFMAGSAHGFETGSLGVIQLLGRVAGGEPWPVGRDWMLTHR